MEQSEESMMEGLLETMDSIITQGESYLAAFKAVDREFLQHRAAIGQYTRQFHKNVPSAYWPVFEIYRERIPAFVLCFSGEYHVGFYLPTVQNASLSPAWKPTMSAPVSFMISKVMIINDRIEKCALLRCSHQVHSTTKHAELKPVDVAECKRTLAQMIAWERSNGGVPDEMEAWFNGTIDLHLAKGYSIYNVEHGAMSDGSTQIELRLYRGELFVSYHLSFDPIRRGQLESAKEKPEHLS